jgi:hypothetical protein
MAKKKEKAAAEAAEEAKPKKARKSAAATAAAQPGTNVYRVSITWSNDKTEEKTVTGATESDAMNTLLEEAKKNGLRILACKQL